MLLENAAGKVMRETGGKTKGEAKAGVDMPEWNRAMFFECVAALLYKITAGPPAKSRRPGSYSVNDKSLVI